MSDPDMSPDEIAWAFQNAGRAPAQTQDTSAQFAAQSRAQEKALAQRRLDLERQLLEEQYRQDQQYNRAVHHQDMAAAQAHHRALMGQYSLVDQIRGKLGLGLLGDDPDGFDWRHGFALGLAVGAIAATFFGWGQK